MTSIFFVTGFFTTVLRSGDSDRVLASEITDLSNIDLLEQGGSITPVTVRPTENFTVQRYVLREGDTPDSLAQRFNIDKESIKLTNLDAIDYHEETITVGKEIIVPDINGILLRAGANEDIDTIMSKVTSGQRLDVIEINNLSGPEYRIPNGTLVLIPDGRIEPPTRPDPEPVFIFEQPSNPVISEPPPSPSNPVLSGNLSGVSFVDPLLNCPGYGYSRGFSSWHLGVDLPAAYGCPIAAAATGTVTFAGWSSAGQGFMVRIDHGNGVSTEYFHGDGNMWVRPGEAVAAGQNIMGMGCSGFCTGTHLHLAMTLDGIFIDPAPFVPYARPF